MSVSINPRAAKFLGLDQHLPPVDPLRLHRGALMARFQAPPPWVPDIEVERLNEREASVEAAVLVPIVMRAQPTILLTQRTAHLKKHAGQISFPGGRSEPSDASPIVTALRETEEEVGLSRERVQVIGQLPTYTTGTGFIVTPVVGLIEPGMDESAGLKLFPDPDEVAEAFEVPMSYLMNPQHHQRMGWPKADQEQGYWEFFAMPWRPDSTDTKEYFIWGATAAMLRNFYRFLSA